MESRRQFFRGLTGKKGPPRRLSRAAAVEAYVRTNLLPYDFCLTDDQVEHLLRTVVSEMTGGEGSEFSSEERRHMKSIAEETISHWRDEYCQAEEKRREALLLVREFLQSQDPEALEMERRALSWLYELPNAQLAPLTAAELKDLVFSKMIAWRQRP